MPRRTRSVPAYRRHRPSGQAIVTLNYRDHYLGRVGSQASRLEYDRLIGEWLQRGRQTIRGDTACAPSIIEVNVAYLGFAQGDYRKDGRTTSEYASILNALRFVKTHYGRHSVHEFGPIALQAVTQRMVKHGLVRRSINQPVGRT